jgi:hypothetical protein
MRRVGGGDRPDRGDRGDRGERPERVERKSEGGPATAQQEA